MGISLPSQAGRPATGLTGAAPEPDDAISRRWGRFIAQTQFSDLPAHVVEMAKARVIDCLATALAAKDLPVPSTALRFIGGNEGPATIIGHERGAGAVDAAFVNATLVNGCTHDDFLYKSHPGAVVLPAALAIAEEQGRHGRDFLMAIVLGYEFVARAFLGSPGMIPRFRATGVAGSIGAAAAAGKLLGLSAEQSANALGCAAMFSSGFGEGFKFGTMDVKLNVGWAARSGVSAALLAACGATSAPTVFEGESGYFGAYSGSDAAPDLALAGLGERYLIEDTVYKERPVCIFVQTPVQLAISLCEETGLDPASITSVSIRAPWLTLTNPGYQNVAPYHTDLQARISVRFTTAAALLGRPVERFDFYKQTSDTAVLALAERILLREPAPDQGDRVDLVVECGGRRHEISAHEMDTLRPTLDKSIAKFRRLTGQLAPGTAQRMLDTVLALDTSSDVHDLARQLRQAHH